MDVTAATSLDAFPWVNVFAFTIAAAFVTLTPGVDTALIVRTAAGSSGRRAIEPASEWIGRWVPSSSRSDCGSLSTGAN